MVTKKIQIPILSITGESLVWPPCFALSLASIGITGSAGQDFGPKNNAHKITTGRMGHAPIKKSIGRITMPLKP